MEAEGLGQHSGDPERMRHAWDEALTLTQENVEVR